MYIMENNPPFPQFLRFLTDAKGNRRTAVYKATYRPKQIRKPSTDIGFFMLKNEVCFGKKLTLFFNRQLAKVYEDNLKKGI
jgi:hypothetical protein